MLKSLIKLVSKLRSSLNNKMPLTIIIIIIVITIIVITIIIGVIIIIVVNIIIIIVITIIIIVIIIITGSVRVKPVFVCPWFRSIRLGWAAPFATYSFDDTLIIVIITLCRRYSV